MPNGFDNRGNMPVSTKSIENIRLGLMDNKINTTHIRQNLDIIIADVKQAGGDPSRLAITADQLKQIYTKIDGRRDKFGQEFPAAQMESLAQIIEQAEAKEAEQNTQNPEQGGDVVDLGQERAKSSILNTIATARTLSELSKVSRDIENFDDNFVVTAKQGSRERAVATDTYNQMSQQLKNRKDDLTRASEILKSINS